MSAGGGRYEVVPGWGQLPAGWSFGEAVGVAVDGRDFVYVFNRGEHPVIVFSSDGEFLCSWGEGMFRRPHGITIHGPFSVPDDRQPEYAVYLTDDVDHTVRKFTTEGDLLLTLGTSGKPSATGATSHDFRTIARAGPPFHYPTNVAGFPHDDLYVADGYGNARVHQFSQYGELIRSWGEPGSGPGQFRIPHGIAVDYPGIVYVADRENSRLQLFSPEGEFLAEWTDVARPCQVRVAERGGRELVFVAELGYRAGMWPGIAPPGPDATGGRVSVFTREGQLVARWGGGRDPGAPGDFFAPHDICVDSRGDVYVAEVVVSAAGAGGIPPGAHTLQKFRWVEDSRTGEAG